MVRNKNYLKYYKKTYLNDRQAEIRKRLIVLFTIVMFITIFIVFYILVRIENLSEMKHL